MPRHAFGPFVLDAGRLLRDGKAVAVGQRGLTLLEALLEADGGVVAKAELMQRAWPGAAVEEGNLAVQIAALRKALGPAPDGDDWIVTVQRVGYRLAHGAATAGAAAVTRPAIAVLPFVAVGADPEQDYFADGVADDIITALSRFRSFAVVARNSSFAYKGRAVDVREIASELGVRYLLQGSVRRAGDRLRIAAQLVEAESGANLWAASFDGAVAEVFDFQDSITDAVASVVEPHIRLAETERSRRERPGSVAAYDIYLRGLSKLLPESAKSNAEVFGLMCEALAHEPDNGLFNAYACWALEHRITMGWPSLGPDDRERCIEFARRGLENAAGDPAIMANCGIALVQVAREYDWGMAVLKAAVETNPNHINAVNAAGVAHLHCGSLDEALALFARAARLSPRDPLAYTGLCGTAHVHMILGNYQEALVWATRSLALNPDFDPAYWMLIAAHAHLGQMDDAHRYLAGLRSIAPDVTIARIKAGQPARDPTRLAAILDGLRMAGMDAG